MIIGILQTARQLLVYAISGVLICLNPYLLYLLIIIRKSRKAYHAWLLIDRLICTIAHNTENRTISGLSGQFSTSKKRYKYQAMVIDWLAYCLAREKNHCAHAYQWEKQNGWAD